MYIVCLATFSWENSLSSYDWAMFTFYYASTFSLAGIAEHLSTKHVRSDLGPFESFVNTGTYPRHIAVFATFSKFRNSRIAHAYKVQILHGA